MSGARLPALLPCPWCGGHAELGEDDGAITLDAWHARDCPACMASDDDHWSAWHYPEDFEAEGGGPATLEDGAGQVAAWWNGRAEARP